jgi:DNA-binding transcriptional ArsR family regulator
MACALLSGTAHTGRELARHVGIAPSTASEHLGHLLAVGLIAVEVQGRHRYYRLAGREIADLLETMMVVPATTAPLPAVPSGLAFARSCYDHLAGELGVRLHDRFVALGAIAVTTDGATLTATGRDLLAEMEVGVEHSRTRPAVRQCLDWSQRRHHLAGAVGARLLAAMTDRRWVYRNGNRLRELRLSEAGRRGLHTHLGIEIT